MGSHRARPIGPHQMRSEEHTSELQSRLHLVCRLLLEKKKQRLSALPRDAIRVIHEGHTQRLRYDIRLSQVCPAVLTANQTTRYALPLQQAHATYRRAD